MKPHFADPEATAAMASRKRRFDRLWLDGNIGDVTYLRSLIIDGMTTAEANTELNLLKMEKARK